MNKGETSEMYKTIMFSDSFVIHESLCLYENVDIFVEQFVMSFPVNTREALLAVPFLFQKREISQRQKL